MTDRSYQQYCPVACALDVLGDRWTLLVIRDLALNGQRRFSDVKGALPGIPPAPLTERLRMLVDEGLVRVEELPPPAARTVYGLTERGREAIPVVRALARFGAPLLPRPDATSHLAPTAAISAMVTAWYDADAAAGIDERYELEVEGVAQVLSSRVGGGGTVEPVLHLSTDAGTLIDLRQGRIELDRAVAQGRVTVRGPKPALRRFARVFALR